MVFENRAWRRTVGTCGGEGIKKDGDSYITKVFIICSSANVAA
jgi:hypothetical protein